MATNKLSPSDLEVLAAYSKTLAKLVLRGDMTAEMAVLITTEAAETLAIERAATKEMKNGTDTLH